MLGQLDVLERVGAGLLEEDADQEALREAARAAHALQSSLNSLRLTRGAGLVADLAELLHKGLAGPGETFRYSKLVVALRDAIEREAPAGVLARGSGRREGRPGSKLLEELESEEAPVLLIIEPAVAAEAAEALAAEAFARGWRPEWLPTAVEARTRAQELPQLVAVTVDPDAGDEAGLEALLESLQSRMPPVPVIFHVEHPSQEARLRAVSMGARAFFPKGSRPAAVLDRAEALSGQAVPPDALALVVDDDHGALYTVSEVLETAGLPVYKLDDPRRFWATLEAVDPDILLLSGDLRAVTARDLCRTVRAVPKWDSLPIILLGLPGDVDSVIASFESGASDLVVRDPLNPRELVARVHWRLGQVAPAQRSDPTEMETLSALQMLERQLRVAAPHADIVTVAVLALESDQSEEDVGVAVRAEAALQKAAAEEDVVARLDRDHVLVSRYAETEVTTREWLERVLPVPPSRRLRLGTATYPDLEDPQALIESARSAMETPVWNNGGSRPLSGQVESDIVVVEDDEVLGALLARTFDRRGYNTHWIRDGAEAVALLAGEEPPLRAQIITLDVGLPGVDGFTLLRRLRRDGVLSRTRVLMVTARASESEVVRALDLGAFDHVAKPFSITELLHRVQRALREDGRRP